MKKMTQKWLYVSWADKVGQGAMLEVMGYGLWARGYGKKTVQCSEFADCHEL